MRIAVKIAAAFGAVVVVTVGVGASGWFGLNQYAGSVHTSDEASLLKLDLSAVALGVAAFRQSGDLDQAAGINEGLAKVHEEAEVLGEQGLVAAVDDYSVAFQSIVAAQAQRQMARQEIEEAGASLGESARAILASAQETFEASNVALEGADEVRGQQVAMRSLAEALRLASVKTRAAEVAFLNEATEATENDLNAQLKDMFLSAVKLSRSARGTGPAENASKQVAKNVNAYRKSVADLIEAPQGSNEQQQAILTLETNSKRIGALTNGMSSLVTYQYGEAVKAADAARQELLNAEELFVLGAELRAEVGELKAAVGNVLVDGLEGSGQAEAAKLFEDLTQIAGQVTTLTGSDKGMADAIGRYQQAFDGIIASIESENAAIAEMSASAGAVFAGVDQILADANAGREGDKQLADMMLIAGGVLAGLLAAGLGGFLAYTLANPIQRMTGAMTSMAKGDLAVDVTDQDRSDEIGEMANALGAFKDQLANARKLEAERAEQERLAEISRKQELNGMADNFEAGVGQVVEAVREAANELQRASGQMSTAAEETSTQATSVAAAAEEASSNVQTVATATEELSSSIEGVAQQVQRSSDVAASAVQRADVTSQAMEELSKQVTKITEIVDLITDVAGQTNLLALNATIEAARAGEAGKGFAVVASEVKTLANQTAQATEQIAQQIEAVRNGTTKAAESIESITQVIAEMNEIAASVNDAIGQQTQATNEIASNVSQASQGTQDVSTTIVSVEASARETGQTASEINSSASSLSSQAETLSSQVNNFLEQVRANNKTEQQAS